MAEKSEEAARRIAEARREGATELDLGDLRLTTLPAEIADLIQLQSLQLDDNQLTALPSEIGALTQLRQLSLHNNQLTELPPEIAALTQLQELLLHSNQLTVLPAEITALTQLQELGLDNNQLTALPTEIAALTQLRQLSLHNNRLTALPLGIEALTQLQNLRLNNNQLTELPSEITSLTQLRELWLNNNQLTELPPEIGALTQLQKLLLDDNALTELPPEITSLTQLRELWLDNNQLTALPPGITALTQLQSLSLARWQLTELPSEITSLTQLRELWLNNNQLTELPSEITALTQLQKLWLNSNQLTELPTEIADLIQLQELKLHNNQLTELPPEITALTQLRTLWLHNNQLTALPPEIAALTQLRTLRLNSNQLTELPPEITALTQLRTLWLHNNQLTALPPEIAALTQLRTLRLNSNQLTALPPGIGSFEKLYKLSIDNNPLPPILYRIADRGLNDLRTYLRSLEGAEPLYEAKLLFVGEGAVGKTSLLACMLGEAFQENRQTTHGIAIQKLELDHPKITDRPIQLNAWDFGGQEVYRITHQFFYSSRSLYLLLWNPRLGVEQCDVEGWIRRIYLRVGEAARILVVATHCESCDRIPRIREGRLRAKYPNILIGFHEVDSLTGSGVSELKAAIAEAAADLEQMGELFNPKWKAARDEVAALPDPHIPFSRFSSICSSHDLLPEEVDVLSHLLHDLGAIVHFSDEEGLGDEVVLQPEWLSKAIGYVLEDRTTYEEAGVLQHQWLRRIWSDHGAEKREHYANELHSFFLQLMEKYDVSYRLEGQSSSLIAQMVPEKVPELPWTSDDPPETGEVTLVCEMSDDPPGLVPWTIVRTHFYATKPRLHWQDGMFLDYGKHGTALLESKPRELWITVRAAWPDYFLSVLRGTVERLIAERWPGLRATFSVPCPGQVDGRPCTNRFAVKSLYHFRRSHTEFLCDKCLGSWEIDRLLRGFSTVSAQEQKIDRVLEGVEHIGGQMEAVLSQQAAHYQAFLRSVNAENQAGPSLFTLLPEIDGSWTRLDQLGQDLHRLTLWCEWPECPHPTCPHGTATQKSNYGELGEYLFPTSKEWLLQVAPYVSGLARILRVAVPLVGAALPLGLNEDVAKTIAPAVRAMTTATSLLKGDFDAPSRPDETDSLMTRVEGAGLRAFHQMLRELDPDKQWGGLRRVFTPSQGYLWLCPQHAAIFAPGPPRME